MNWTVVYTSAYDTMERMQVDGGWLYRNRVVVNSSAQEPSGFVWSVALTFVPEPATTPPAEGASA